MRNKRAIVAISVSAVIVAVVMAITIAVGAMHEIIDNWVVGYKSTAVSSQARAASEALLNQIQEEGTVLVRNETNDGASAPVLPLDKKTVTKLNVFGWASVDWVYSGSGSGTIAGTKNRSDKSQTQIYDLYDALDEAGIEYNTTLKDKYTSYKSRREKANPLEEGNSQTLGALHSFNYEFSVLYEPELSSDDKTQAEGYSDTALVVLGRVTGESNDCPKVQYKWNKAPDETRTYLEISTEEEELLTYVGSHYENVIVLINSTNVMELGFLETIDGLDACLLTMTTGSSGARAIPGILYGEKTVDILDSESKPTGETETVKVSPSGRTADTWAYDLRTNPTYATVGSGIKGTNGNGASTVAYYTNSDSGLYPMMVKHTNGSSQVDNAGVAYTDYLEGIYVGYKWYETADAVGFWNDSTVTGHFGINGYDDVVQFPFGYGLSYTEFEWSAVQLFVDGELALDGATVKEDSVITVSVSVTNVGEFPGQDVVELYYTPPTEGSSIEKAEVNLVAFAKTQGVLDPQESETVTLTFKVSDMKSFDYLDAAGMGAGYVLEGGDYLLTLRTDSHTLADSGEHARLDHGATHTVRIASTVGLDDPETGASVEARFTGEGTKDGVAIDGNTDQSAGEGVYIEYISRYDEFTNFPYSRPEEREMTSQIRALNLFTAADAAQWRQDNPTDVVYEQGVAGTEMIATVDSKNIDTLTDYGRQFGNIENFDDDVLWDELLNRLTQKEMQDLVLHGYAKTMALDTIGKPKTVDLDGPNQIGSFKNDTMGATGFSSIVLAASWNTELAYSMGLTVGGDAIFRGIRGWYGPAVNLHRSPFGGRNYEYYSEDPLLSGRMAAREIEAAKNCGVYCYLKHLCLYESESGRDGMYNWLTEQALRETYIRPFEICVKEGGATGIMTSYGRIGAVWTGGSSTLLNDVLRGEWGFKGAIITDYADDFRFMNGDHMIRGGGDLWMDHWDDSGQFSYPSEINYAEVTREFRRAAKNVIFMYTNALLTQEEYNEKIANGEVDGVQVQTGARELNFRWYIPVVAVLDVVALAGCGTWLFFTFRKKKSADPDSAASDPAPSDTPKSSD